MKTRQLFSGSLLVAVANGASKGLALAFMALAARLLSLEEFGQLALVMALGALLGGVVATGLPQGLMWGLGRANGEKLEPGIGRGREAEERYLACAVAGTALLGGITVAGLTAVVALGSLAGTGWGWLPLLAGAVVATDGVNYLYLNLLQGRLKPAKIALYSLLRNGLKLGLLGGLAGMVALGGETAQPGVTGVVFFYAVAPLAALVAVEMWRAEGLALKLGQVSRTGLAGLARYGAPIILSSMAFLLITQGDLLLLGHYHGEGETALYSAPKHLMMAVLLLPVAARNLLIPTVAANAHSKEGLLRVWGAVWGLAALAAIVLAVGGPTLVELLFGADYKVDRLVMVLLPVAALAQALSALLGAYWLGKGKPALVMEVDWLAALVGLGLYLWLIPDRGAEGAAIGLVSATLLGAGLLALLSWRLKGSGGLKIFRARKNFEPQRHRDGENNHTESLSVSLCLCGDYSKARAGKGGSQ